MPQQGSHAAPRRRFPWQPPWASHGSRHGCPMADAMGVPGQPQTGGSHRRRRGFVNCNSSGKASSLIIRLTNAHQQFYPSSGPKWRGRSGGLHPSPSPPFPPTPCSQLAGSTRRQRKAGSAAAQQQRAWQEARIFFDFVTRGHLALPYTKRRKRRGRIRGSRRRKRR